jgi:hypothetical protein
MRTLPDNQTFHRVSFSVDNLTKSFFCDQYRSSAIIFGVVIFIVVGFRINEGIGVIVGAGPFTFVLDNITPVVTVSVAQIAHAHPSAI